jgi:hypothetical protein
MADLDALEEIDVVQDHKHFQLRTQTARHLRQGLSSGGCRFTSDHPTDRPSASDN